MCVRVPLSHQPGEVREVPRRPPELSHGQGIRQPVGMFSRSILISVARLSNRPLLPVWAGQPGQRGVKKVSSTGDDLPHVVNVPRRLDPKPVTRVLRTCLAVGSFDVLGMGGLWCGVCGRRDPLEILCGRASGNVHRL